MDKSMVFFNFCGDVFAYDFKTSFVFSLNNLTYDVLNKYNEGNSIKEIKELLTNKYDKIAIDKAIEALNILIDNNIISSHNKKSNENFNVVTDKNCEALTLMLTNRCNFNCNYCFEKNKKKKDMSKETIKKAIDLLFLDNDNDKKTISFFGGEPLLKVDLIEYAINYIKQNNWMDLAVFAITTNGSLYNDRIMEIIKQNNIYIMTSVDGNKEIHDKNRVTKDNKPTFDLIMDKVKMYSDLKSISTFKNTITKETVKEYFDFYKYCNNNDLDLTTAIVADEEVGFNNENDVDELINVYEDICTYYMNSIKQNESIQLPPFLRSFASLYPDIRSDNFCPINNKFTIDTNGDMYACHRFCGDDKFIIGNINDIQSLNPIHYNKDLSFCNECWAKRICLGGCIHENYIYSGNIVKSTEALCKLRKSIVKLTVSVYGSLCKNAPGKLRNIIGESLYDKNTLRYLPLYDL